MKFSRRIHLGGHLFTWWRNRPGAGELAEHTYIYMSEMRVGGIRCTYVSERPECIELGVQKSVKM